MIDLEPLCMRSHWQSGQHDLTIMIKLERFNALLKMPMACLPSFTKPCIKELLPCGAVQTPVMKSTAWLISGDYWLWKGLCTHAFDELHVLTRGGKTI